MIGTLLWKAARYVSQACQRLNITRSLPCQERGYITFGTLNNPYKFGEETFDCWGRILAEIRESKLLFVRREFQSWLLRKNVLEALMSRGIGADRVLFFNNRIAGRHYLDCYNEIDISLDTFPVTGGTTTIDSLWMGCPVVALEGSYMHQRISSSILRNAGLHELVAVDVEDYVDMNVRIARDTCKLEGYRKSLRERLQTSPLCDGQKFTESFAACLIKEIRCQAYK